MDSPEIVRDTWTEPLLQAIERHSKRYGFVLTADWLREVAARLPADVVEVSR